MPATFKTTRRVEFRDTDAAGIMHFSMFFVYMEQAEHELLRSVGLSVKHADDEGTVSWPRVAASCDYRKAAKFEQVLDIEVQIERIGERSVSFAFRFTSGGEELATGKITTVCCRLRDGRPPQSMPIPAWFAEKLTAFTAGC